MSLRWIERDGKMVLEMGSLRHPITPDHDCNCWDWREVPTHQEPKKSCDCSKIPSCVNVYGGNRCDVCGSMRPPKRLTVEDELADAMFKVGEWTHPKTCAKAAIEFFKARMPKASFAPNWQKSEYGHGYAAAIEDTNKALFGEA